MGYSTTFTLFTISINQMVFFARFLLGDRNTLSFVLQLWVWVCGRLSCDFEQRMFVTSLTSTTDVKISIFNSSC